MTNKINGIDVSEYFTKYNNISITAKIEDILHFYATSFISPLQYPDIHYDTSKAREGLELLKFIKEYCKHLEQEKDGMQIVIDNYIEHSTKYKQALEEIREIVSDEINKTDTDDELMQIYGTIYNRCSEVLNDRN